MIELLMPTKFQCWIFFHLLLCITNCGSIKHDECPSGSIRTELTRQKWLCCSEFCDNTSSPYYNLEQCCKFATCNKYYVNVCNTVILENEKSSKILSDTKFSESQRDTKSSTLSSRLHSLLYNTTTVTAKEPSTRMPSSNHTKSPLNNSSDPYFTTVASNTFHKNNGLLINSTFGQETNPLEIADTGEKRSNKDLIIIGALFGIFVLVILSLFIVILSLFIQKKGKKSNANESTNVHCKMINSKTSVTNINISVQIRNSEFHIVVKEAVNHGVEKRYTKEPQCAIEGSTNLNEVRETEILTISEIGDTCNEMSPCLLPTTIPLVSTTVAAEIHNVQNYLTDDNCLILPDYLNMPQEIFRENLIVEKLIGNGQFGQVLKGKLQKSNNRIEVALKTHKMNSRLLNTQEFICLQLELRIFLFMGQHINVVRLIGAVTQPCVYGNLVLVCEFCQFGDLRNYITKRKCFYESKEFSRSSETRSLGSYDEFTLILDCNMQDINFDKSVCNELDLILKKNILCPAALLMYALQIANGAHFFSRCNVIHRDLALRNILLTSDHIVKIGDFGLAVNDIEYEVKSPKPLPIRWLAPESLLGIFTAKSDVYTFGIVLWELFSLGDNPRMINASYNAEKFRQWLLDGNKLDRPKYAPDLINQLMLQTWQLEPNLRPSFKQCRTEIKDILINHSQDVFAYVAEKISLEV